MFLAAPGSASEGQRDGTSGDGRDLALLVPLDGQVGREQRERRRGRRIGLGGSAEV